MGPNCFLPEPTKKFSPKNGVKSKKEKMRLLNRQKIPTCTCIWTIVHFLYLFFLKENFPFIFCFPGQWACCLFLFSFFFLFFTCPGRWLFFFFLFFFFDFLSCGCDSCFVFLFLFFFFLFLV